MNNKRKIFAEIVDKMSVDVTHRNIEMLYLIVILILSYLHLKLEMRTSSLTQFERLFWLWSGDLRSYIDIFDR